MFHIYYWASGCPWPDSRRRFPKGCSFTIWNETRRVCKNRASVMTTSLPHKKVRIITFPIHIFCFWILSACSLQPCKSAPLCLYLSERQLAPCCACMCGDQLYPVVMRVYLSRVVCGSLCVCVCMCVLVIVGIY